VDVVKRTILHDIWLVGLWANLHKAHFILYFPNQNILIIEKDFIKKGTWLNHHEHLKRAHG
jgi:hypothetical protein